jgi:adenine-specific DNA-methyltransferase
MKSNDYQNWSKNELISEIKSLKKRKKYGLVWEDKPEDVVEKCKDFLPILKEIKENELAFSPSGPDNILIEGDNYHALSVLNFTHKKKIDVIYIDPPYNTGAKDWKYNNHFVDINDTYRHSKWLSMMANRLKLARNLLSKDGVLIVTIDDNEACTLGLLLDEIFPDKERATVVIKYNPAGTARNGFSRNHEYAYFMLNKGQEIEKKPAPRDIRDQNLRRHGNGANRQDSPTMFYPIYVEKDSMLVIGVGEVPDKDFHPTKQTIDKGSYFEVWPMDDKNKEKRWYYGIERVRNKGNQELTCKWVKDRLHVYFHTDNEAEQKYPSVWVGSEYDSGAHGGTLVKKMISVEFPFPKSVFAVKDCLSSIIRNKKEATVLDFFAGSGTTGHATMLMNAEDGGKRGFILCTNNEDNNGSGHKIATDICYPRIKKAITGYIDEAENKIDGIVGNLKYFQTDFIDQVKTDNDKRVFVNHCTEMLCLAESTFEEVLNKKNEFAIYDSINQTTGIIYDEDSIEDFKKAIRNIKKPISVYVFSYTHEYNEEDFSDLDNIIKIKPIPEVILNTYKKIFKDALVRKNK